VGGEYDVAREHFGYGDADLLELTRTAIHASFAEPELRARLLARTDDDGLPRS
jgi:adenosine deaminase